MSISSKFWVPYTVSAHPRPRWQKTVFKPCCRWSFVRVSTQYADFSHWIIIEPFSCRFPDGLRDGEPGGGRGAPQPLEPSVDDLVSACRPNQLIWYTFYFRVPDAAHGLRDGEPGGVRGAPQPLEPDGDMGPLGHRAGWQVGSRVNKGKSAIEQIL